MAPVSVVIPCFRCVATVTAALDSVARQTARPLEIIIVDDASDDHTPEVLSDLVRRHGGEWLRTIRLPKNAGPASARNAGWEAAKGDYVAFLDADDTWHPRKLEIQHALMQKDPTIAVCAHGFVIGTLPEIPSSTRPRIDEITHHSLLWRNRFAPACVMVKRRIGARFPEGQRHMEDQRAWLEFAFSGYRFVSIDLPLAAQHKPHYGVSGLSADLLAMERAELGNYWHFWRSGRIGTLMLATLLAWSVAKFLRRLVVVAWRKSLSRASGIARCW